MNKFVALISAATLALGLASPASAQTDSGTGGTSPTQGVTVTEIGSTGTTALEIAANSLSAGQWISLQTNDINAVLGSAGADVPGRSIFGFTDDIVWDPISQQLFFTNGDFFVSYTEQTNTWQRLPKEPWFRSAHGYDHNAIDPAGRAFFFRPYNEPYVQRYDITSGTWTKSPSFSGKINVNCCSALEYFPELQGTVFSNAAAIIWEDGTS